MAAKTARKPGRDGRAQRNHGRPEVPPEQAARRKFLAGKSAEAMTEYPLGIMLVNGIITQEQHDAGIFYAFLYGRFCGRQIMGAVPVESMARFAREFSDEHQTRIERLYREGRKVIDNPQALSMLEDAAVFLRAPSWIRPAIRTVAEVGEQRVFIAVLQKLALWMAIGRREKSAPLDKIRASR